MKTHTIKYTNEPIGRIKIVKDFLSSPDAFRLLEDIEDYFYANKALKEGGSISLEDLEK